MLRGGHVGERRPSRLELEAVVGGEIRRSPHGEQARCYAVRDALGWLGPRSVATAAPVSAVLPKLILRHSRTSHWTTDRSLTSHGKPDWRGSAHSAFTH